MDLKSYTLEELELHINSAFSENDGIVPVSPLRLTSYLKNPRAEKTDPVLFELREEGKLVAYRTLLPDYYLDQNLKPQRFAWLSGNYTDPGFRRQGLSTRLLQMVEALWDGKLMYTNYAPASKAVYDQTGQFPLMVQRPGKRFYLRSSTKELLGNRLGSHELLKTGDKLVNRLREGKLQKFQGVSNSHCQIERKPFFDPELTKLINQSHLSQQSTLFQRDADVFSWIVKYPWVTDQAVDPLNYPFTYRAHRFENLLLQFTMPKGTGTGLLWLVIHNQKLSVPYVFVNNKELFLLMARTLLHTMITQNCAYTTLRHPELLEQLLNHRKWFLSIRNMPQNLFAHKKIGKQIPAGKIIQDGDGDVVFTG